MRAIKTRGAPLKFFKKPAYNNELHHRDPIKSIVLIPPDRSDTLPVPLTSTGREMAATYLTSAQTWPPNGKATLVNTRIKGR
jgi:hypothetical protein